MMPMENRASNLFRPSNPYKRLPSENTVEDIPVNMTTMPSVTKHLEKEYQAEIKTNMERINLVI